MAFKLKLKKYRQSKEDKFDESGISEEDIMDIVREDESEETKTNTSFENEADDIKDTDSEEGDGNIFGGW